MKTATFNFHNRIVKEIHFSHEDIKDIERAEKQKARLENDGFTLKFNNVGFTQTTMGYVKRLI